MIDLLLRITEALAIFGFLVVVACTLVGATVSVLHDRRSR